MRLGYLLNVFPVLSETFVLREMRSLEAMTGRPPVVASMYRPGRDAQRSSGTDIAKDCLYFRDIDKGDAAAIASSFGSFFLKRPFGAVKAVAAGPRAGLRDRIKTARLARFFTDRGVTQLHTHFAWPHLETLKTIRSMTGIPFTATVHAADIFTGDARVPGWLREASLVTTISDFNRKYLRERLGVPDEKIRVVRCGIPIERYPYREAPGNKKPAILSVGRMVEKKGFDVLLRALALLRDQGMDFYADIVGDGPLRPSLEILCSELELDGRVVFHGALEPGAAAELMRGCDVFALACKRAQNGDMDGIPVVLMEAMATGRPVVSTSLSGIPELVGEDCGALAAPGSPEDFAEALASLLVDPGLRRDLGVQGRRRVEREYGADRQSQGLLSVLREASGAEAGR